MTGGGGNPFVGTRKHGQEIVSSRRLLVGLRRDSPRLEVKRSRIDAVSEACWLRPIFKTVAEMRVALLAEDLGSRCEQTGVHFRFDVLFVDWLVEARPTGSRVKLRARVKKRSSAADALVNAGVFVIPILAAPRGLSRFLTSHHVLLVCETAPPFRVLLVDRRLTVVNRRWHAKGTPR